VDIVLNPLGVPSRMNLDSSTRQLSVGGGGARRQFASPIFDGATWRMFRESCTKRMNESPRRCLSTADRVKFEPGGNGRVIYMLSVAPGGRQRFTHDDRTVLPDHPAAAGREGAFGGQSLEKWKCGPSRIRRGARPAVDPDVKSDDVSGRAKVYEAMSKGEPARIQTFRNRSNVVDSGAYGLGLDVKLD